MQLLTALIDRIDSAAALASAIRTSREADARHYRLAQERRAPKEMPAGDTRRSGRFRTGARPSTLAI